MDFQQSLCLNGKLCTYFLSSAQAGVEYLDFILPEMPRVAPEDFLPENRWNYITTLGHLLASPVAPGKSSSASTSVGILTNLKVTRLIEKQHMKADNKKTKPNKSEKMFWVGRLSQIGLKWC